MSSAKEGVDLEFVGECLGTGADSFLVKPGGITDLSPLLSDSEWGCDGELDLCETESVVEAGEGGAWDSECFPCAVPGRLSSSGAFKNGAEAFSFSFSFSLFLTPFRLNHLSFPTPLLFGNVVSTEGLSRIGGMTSDLPSRWGDETLAGEDVLPEADELVDTETTSGVGFFSLPWLLIFTEGTCRNEWNNPPCDL